MRDLVDEGNVLAPGHLQILAYMILTSDSRQIVQSRAKYQTALREVARVGPRPNDRDYEPDRKLRRRVARPAGCKQMPNGRFNAAEYF